MNLTLLGIVEVGGRGGGGGGGGGGGAAALPRGKFGMMSRVFGTTGALARLSELGKMTGGGGALLEEDDGLHISLSMTVLSGGLLEHFDMLETPIFSSARKGSGDWMSASDMRLSLFLGLGGTNGRFLSLKDSMNFLGLSLVGVVWGDGGGGNEFRLDVLGQLHSSLRSRGGGGGGSESRLVVLPLKASGGGGGGKAMSRLSIELLMANGGGGKGKPAICS